MSQVGFIRRIAVDPDEHNGNTHAAGLVTRVHDDGTYDMRVFADDPLGADQFRTHVDLTGDAHDYSDTAPLPAPSKPAAGAQPAEPTPPASGAVDVGVDSTTPPAEQQPVAGSPVPPATFTGVPIDPTTVAPGSDTPPDAAPVVIPPAADPTDTWTAPATPVTPAPEPAAPTEAAAPPATGEQGAGF